jgi:lipoate-protein ligase B
MQAFTDARAPETPDEIWLTEHPPIYTLGLAGRREHLHRDNGIPVLKVDRGGQITYHGPGQLIAYLLIDIGRRRLGVRRLVRAIEDSVIQLLDSYGVAATVRGGAPGVYVQRMSDVHSPDPLANAAGIKHKGDAKTARIPIKIVPAERLKKPDWIRVRAPSSPRFYEIKRILRRAESVAAGCGHSTPRSAPRPAYERRPSRRTRWPTPPGSSTKGTPRPRASLSRSCPPSD